MREKIDVSVSIPHIWHHTAFADCDAVVRYSVHLALLASSGRPIDSAPMADVIEII